METKIPLYGHNSSETAYEITKIDHSIRYWVERSPSVGFWLCSQVKIKNNPWGNVKRITYSKFAMNMYTDKNKHFYTQSVNEYSSGQQALDFVKTFPQSDFQYLKSFASDKLEFVKGLLFGKIEYHSDGTKTESEKFQDEEQIKAWEEVVKILNTC